MQNKSGSLSKFKSAGQIGLVIRDLRRQRNMTGGELGSRANLSQSKISKIETGFYTKLHYDEIKRILNILNTPSDILQQVLNAISDNNNGGLRASFSGIDSPLSALAELERRTKKLRVYVVHAIPSLLQTAQYRSASLKCKGFNGDQISENVNRNLIRQDMLWDKGRKHHIIITQNTLYTCVGSKNVQLAQLDRVERSIGLPNLKLGVIPVEAGLSPTENGSFAIYDTSHLIQGIAQGQITIKDTDAIELHSKIFATLDSLAYYDEDAIRLIRQASHYFS